MTSRPQPFPPLTTRALTTPAELAGCVSVYRDAFGLPPGEAAINARLLAGIRLNSGLVVGAVAGSRVVGFTASFLARDQPGDRLYQYSQVAAVLPTHQGMGVGRALKHAQRQAALDQGITLIRWAFDPLQARNAHVNLDVLGGEVRLLRPDMYGEPATGPDQGLPTDRAIVDWHLTSDRVVDRAVPAGVARRPDAGDDTGLRDLGVGQLVRHDERVLLGIPAHWHGYRRQVGLETARQVRATIRDRLSELIQDGFSAVSCRRVTPTVAGYVLRRNR